FTPLFLGAELHVLIMKPPNRLIRQQNKLPPSIALIRFLVVKQSRSRIAPSYFVVSS
ncbi:12325_t:CDS:2, partial [Funneliformis mosseae]